MKNNYVKVAYLKYTWGFACANGIMARQGVIAILRPLGLGSFVRMSLMEWRKFLSN